MRFAKLKEWTVLTSTHTHTQTHTRQLNNMVKMAEDRELYLGLNIEIHSHSIPHNAMAFCELLEPYSGMNTSQFCYGTPTIEKRRERRGKRQKTKTKRE